MAPDPVAGGTGTRHPVRMPRLLLVLASLAACSPTPEVDASRFQGLVPPAPEGTPPLLPPSVDPAPSAAKGLPTGPRVEALRARAAALSGPVVEEAERERLERGVRR